MTHEELVTKIKTPNEFFGVKYAPDWQHVALLAVVELHKSDGHFCVECSHDVDYLFNYPCKTIQTIEEHLK